MASQQFANITAIVRYYKLDFTRSACITLICARYNVTVDKKVLVMAFTVLKIVIKTKHG